MIIPTSKRRKLFRRKRNSFQSPIFLPVSIFMHLSGGGKPPNNNNHNNNNNNKDYDYNDNNNASMTSAL